MTELGRVYLDTAPLIYYLQKDDNFFEQTRQIFINLRRKNVEFISSDLTIAEYSVHPYREQKFELIRAFDDFLRLADVEIISTNKLIARKAAKIRAKYDKFKPMDSLQLATAVLSCCDTFFTNDKQLRQFDEIKVMTLDDFNF